MVSLKGWTSILNTRNITYLPHELSLVDECVQNSTWRERNGLHKIVLDFRRRKRDSFGNTSPFSATLTLLLIDEN